MGEHGVFVEQPVAVQPVRTPAYGCAGWERSKDGSVGVHQETNSRSLCPTVSLLNSQWLFNPCERPHMGEPRSGERAAWMAALDLQAQQDAELASAGWERSRDGSSAPH